jgi:hypothetical protein
MFHQPTRCMTTANFTSSTPNTIADGTINLLRQVLAAAQACGNAIQDPIYLDSTAVSIYLSIFLSVYLCML